MKLHVVLVFVGELRRRLQAFGGPAGLKVCARQVESGFEIRGPHALKMNDWLGWRALRQEHQAEVVVRVAVRWRETKDAPELLLGKVELSLRDVHIADAVARASGVGLKLDGLLESFEGAGIIFFANVYNPKQIVAFGVRGISLQLFPDFCFGLGYAAFAEQPFRFGEERRHRLCELLRSAPLCGRLLRSVCCSARGNHR